MSTLIRLLEESVLVQGSITLVVVATLCYMYLTSQPVPQELVTIVMLVLGYYFGNKVSYQTRKAQQDYENLKSNHND